MKNIKPFKIRRQGEKAKKKKKSRAEGFVLRTLGNQGEPQVAEVENPEAQKPQHEARHPPCQGHSRDQERAD